MNQLTLRYEFDPDDKFGGWLEVEVTSGHFSGRTRNWAQRQDVAAFGEALRSYPIAAEAPVVGVWGVEPWEGEALVIRLEAAPVNPRGDLRFSVEIAEDRDQPKRLRTAFLTHYPALEAFSDAIVNMMSGEADEAVLGGELNSACAPRHLSPSSGGRGEQPCPSGLPKDTMSKAYGSSPKPAKPIGA